MNTGKRTVDKVDINEYRVTGPSETGEIETHTWRIEPSEKYFDPHHPLGEPDSYYNQTPEERSALRRDAYLARTEQPEF